MNEGRGSPKLGLLKLDVNELAAIKGVGPAKAAKLKAAFEIATRVRALGTEDRQKIASPDDVVNLIGLEMSLLEKEELRVEVLDTKHRVLKIERLYEGSVNQAQVRIAEVFKSAIKLNAVAIIVVHNHPSGDPTPSGADVSLTTELERAGQLLDIDLLDHLIAARSDDGHARERGIFGRRHGQRLDVVGAGGEQSRHPRQRARFVFEQDGDDVSHAYTRIISFWPAPAGIIG